MYCAFEKYGSFCIVHDVNNLLPTLQKIRIIENIAKFKHIKK